jgi:hypothetical protein
MAGTASPETFEEMVEWAYSLVDHIHPTTTELLDDAVVRDGLADHEWRRNSGCNLRDGKKQVNEGQC